MAYKINFTDQVANPNGITVADQDLNTQTSLTFVGKNYPGYAQSIGENFLHLLENFANNSAPNVEKAVVGQLWYDTTSSNPQLKVLDGSKNWVPASGIIKSSIRPSDANIGDLWSDSTNQQLYLYTGTQWLLVGPQFNQASSTGLKVEEIIDRATNLQKLVMTMFIEDKRVAIFSKEQFTPKSTLAGFEAIKQGITLSSEDFDLSGINKNKFWGTSEKAESLVIGNNVIAASNFLRSDVVSTTNNTLNVRSSTGLNIGPSLETAISSSIVGTVIHQKTPGSVIVLKTTESGTNVFNDVVTVTGDKKVGINKNPSATLDVEGNISSTGILRITDTTNDVSNTGSTSVGSALFSGGVGIAKTLNVGENLNIVGLITASSDILPKVNNSLNLGSSTVRFNNVYSRNIIGDTITANAFSGQLFGSVSGSASQLASSVNFSITGDVTTNASVSFNGTSGVVLNTEINPNFISNKVSVSDINENDLFLLSRPGSSSLNKVTRSILLKGIGVVPVGSIMPFAGESLPPGYLLCDGSEQSRTVYARLFDVIGFRYRNQNLLAGFLTFALPDLRGRFPLGRENMKNGNTVNKEIQATGVSRNAVASGAITARFVVKDGPPLNPGDPGTLNGPFQVGRTLLGTGLNVSVGAAVVSSVNSIGGGQTEIIVTCSPQTVALEARTDLNISSVGVIDAGGGNPTPARVPTATLIGNVGGTGTHTLSINQIPEHRHDLKDSVGNQYYAVRNATGPVPEPNVEESSLYFTSSSGHFLKNSGGIDTAGSLGQTFDIVNPYQTINYIIYTGRIVE
jgi:microcystin-dependent protein